MMTPDKCQSFLMDNVEGMRLFPDKFFDLAICDIRYGIGASKPSLKMDKVKQSNGKYLPIKRAKYQHSDWDSQKEPQAYFDELFRVSKNQIVFGANYYPQLTGGMIVWDKLNGNTDQFGVEIAYQSFNQRTDVVYYLWSGFMQGKYCSKDVKMAITQEGNKALNEKRIHECQKPVKLYEYLLKEYATTGQIILDTHEGSGSLKIACYKNGFEYYGFENNEYHFNNAQARFSQEVNRLSIEEELKSKQLQLF